MTKKLWIIGLFNSCGGGYGSYYPSIWHPTIPYCNQFNFQKVRWWGYACHQCIQPHWKSWRKFGLLGYFQTSKKDVIKWTSFIRLASFKPISTPLTYSPVILLFDGFVLIKKISEWVRGMHTRGGTVHRCHGSVRTSVRGSRFDTISVQHEKKRNLLCSVSFHLFWTDSRANKKKSI